MESERLARRKKTANTLGWAFIVIAVLALIGIVVCLFILGVGKGDEILLYVLSASFFGGVLLFGGAGYLLTRYAERLERRCVDAFEREEGENTFSVGEGTFVTFSKGGILVHRSRREKGGRTVRIPYAEIKAYSVCLRREAKEDGEWCAVFEVPAKHLAKKGTAAENEKVCLVTEGKQRLYDCLKRENISLIGETPPAFLTEGGRAEKKPAFRRQMRANLPKTKNSRNALFVLVAGGALVVAGILVAIFASPQIGSVMAVVGAYLSIQGAFTLVRRKTYLAAYDEGVYYRAESSFDSIFLKWEEIDSIAADGDRLVFTCPVTAYRFPYHSAFLLYCKEKHPELCKEDQR